MDRKFGELTTIVGPMFSGKSSRLIEILSKYNNKKKTIYIMYMTQNKLENYGMISIC